MSKSRASTVHIARPDSGERIAVIVSEGNPIQFDFDLSEVASQALAGQNLVLTLSNGAEIILIGYGTLLPRIGRDVTEFVAGLDEEADQEQTVAGGVDERKQDSPHETDEARTEIQIAETESAEEGKEAQEETDSKRPAEIAERDGQEAGPEQQVYPDSPRGDGGAGFETAFSGGALPDALAVFGAEIPGLPGDPDPRDEFFDLFRLFGNGTEFSTLLANQDSAQTASLGDPDSGSQFGDPDDGGSGGGEGGDEGDGDPEPEPGLFLIGTDDADTLIGGAGADFIQGLGGNDVLRGNAGGDFIDGGDGFDILYSGSGADTLVGGDKNDILVIEDIGDSTVDQGEDFESIDGGAGFDTLIFGSSGQSVSLDFTAFTDSPITRVEHIDLRGEDGDQAEEANDLAIELEDVLDLVGDPTSVVFTDAEEELGNTLLISGDALDSVTVGSDFTRHPRAATETVDGNVYDVYLASDGLTDVMLLIDQDIAQIV